MAFSGYSLYYTLFGLKRVKHEDTKSRDPAQMFLRAFFTLGRFFFNFREVCNSCHSASLGHLGFVNGSGSSSVTTVFEH